MTGQSAARAGTGEGRTAGGAASAGPLRPRPDAATAVCACVSLLLAVTAVSTLRESPFLLAGPLALAVVTPWLVRSDVSEHRLPNRLVLPCLPVALAGIVAHALATGGIPVIALATGGAYLLLFLSMNLAGGMGMGDVKLAAVMGLVLGSLGITPAFLGILVAFVSGGAVGASALVVRLGRGRRIAFGPFLLAGFWVALALA